MTKAMSTTAIAYTQIPLFYPTWAKYQVLLSFTSSMHIRDRRQVFVAIRSHRSTVNENSFMPHFGLTVGEFCVMQVLPAASSGRAL